MRTRVSCPRWRNRPSLSWLSGWAQALGASGGVGSRSPLREGGSRVSSQQQNPSTKSSAWQRGGCCPHPLSTAGSWHSQGEAQAFHPPCESSEAERCGPGMCDLCLPQGPGAKTYSSQRQSPAEAKGGRGPAPRRATQECPLPLGQFPGGLGLSSEPPASSPASFPDEERKGPEARVSDAGSVAQCFPEPLKPAAPQRLSGNFTVGFGNHSTCVGTGHTGTRGPPSAGSCPVAGGGGGCEESCRAGPGHEEGTNVEGAHSRAPCVPAPGLSDPVCKMETTASPPVPKEGLVLQEAVRCFPDVKGDAVSSRPGEICGVRWDSLHC